MTTAYVMVMSLAGAIATGLSVPLSDYLTSGWQASLAIWAVFAGMALLLWLPEACKPAETLIARPTDYQDAGAPIWRSALAWQVTLFMGLQFLVYYVMLGWMPLFLADQGVTPARAGWLLTLYQVVAFGSGFIAPSLLQRGGDQRAVAVLSCLVTALATCGLLLAPGLAAVWLFILGGSFGISFILAFAFIGMRAQDHRRAASLSTLSQGVAYLVAAAGPPAFGWLHDFTRHWAVPMASLAAIALMQAVAGYGAGRNRHV
jgi:MFS transporter, CP family, cyanate transporter